ELVSLAMEMKKGMSSRALESKAIALLFEKPSLRTRVSFEMAIHQLGGYAMYLSPAEVGLGKRESVQDVARVLSRYVNGIVARTFSHKSLVLMAEYATVPVINALSDLEHPCQALADVLTITEKKGRLAGLTLAYIGDGNNCANSLFLSCMLTGINFNIASPSGYEMDAKIVEKGKKLGLQNGARLYMSNKPSEAVKEADVIYTDVWTSMGQESEAEQRRAVFAGYQVNSALIAQAKKDVIIMHPLPAHHGEEVAHGILEKPASVVFDQAENRLHMQKAILTKLYR
ncbi:MAG: ornithine carbamoyltransferase, partial [Dehalococcoidia bacterium]|nr:ornithine carbamoyltransferase [Dehalococcoidia bacterium]